MAIDKRGDVGAGGNDFEILASSLGESRAHEQLGETASAQLGRNRRVGKRDHIARPLVFAEGEMALDGRFKATRGDVMGDAGHGRRHRDQIWR